MTYRETYLLRRIPFGLFTRRLLTETTRGLRLFLQMLRMRFVQRDKSRATCTALFLDAIYIT